MVQFHLFTCQWGRTIVCADWKIKIEHIHLFDELHTTKLEIISIIRLIFIIFLWSLKGLIMQLFRWGTINILIRLTFYFMGDIAK